MGKRAVNAAAEVPLLDRRSAGLLLHPTCLPSPHGIGDLGAEARAFAQLVASAGCSWWQVLPVTPPAFGGVPYASTSAFAGNPALIDLRGLVEDGLLLPGELPPVHQEARVDFGWVHHQKLPRLELAFARAPQVLARRDDLAADYRGFKKRERRWLEDFALFSALHEHQQHRSWVDWDPGLRDRKSSAIKKVAAEIADPIERHRFSQWLFDRQWRLLRGHAATHRVKLLGDLPIFVALDSADVWAHRGLFKLDRRGRPKEVAGVPPDYFSEDGQLWGNPLYDWDAMRRDGYRWWIDRFRSLLSRFDAVRVDHFIGFYRAWHVPAESNTAKTGRWRPGPRAHLFKALGEALGELPVVAEDLGAVTPEVWALRDRFGLPGMRVLQFAFGDRDKESEHLPHTYPRRAVVYTGTHDNDTVNGWFAELGAKIAAGGEDAEAAAAQRAHLLAYLGGLQDSLHWALVRLALASPANLAIIPVQDLLGLGSEGRMNVPGVPEGNWAFRLLPGAITGDHAARMAELSSLYGRVPPR
jgi:4-alpha-glucanotransferase